MSVDLATLDGLVGQYVSIERPRTALEVEAYGSGVDGGSGVVVKVHPQDAITQSYRGQAETLTGRRVDFDYGMSAFVTPNATVVVDYAAGIAETLAHAARKGQDVREILTRALEGAARHPGLPPAGTKLPGLLDDEALAVAHALVAGEVGR